MYYLSTKKVQHSKGEYSIEFIGFISVGVLKMVDMLLETLSFTSHCAHGSNILNLIYLTRFAL